MSKFLPVRLFFVWLLFGILLAGCGNSPSSDEEPPVYSPARVLTPEAPGKKTLGSSPLILDISNQDQGYLTAESDSDDSRMNIQLTAPSGVVYSYFLEPDEQTVLPFSEGSGEYLITCYQQVDGNQYAALYTETLTIKLQNEFLPFLYPNQYVNFNPASAAVQKGAELSAGAADQIGVVTAIYNYVINNLTYDTAKAQSVQSGYLPNVDVVLAQKKGICFDYAALMTAMLRSQDIPTKLVVGYTGSLYHAWINVYLDGQGWVDNVIYFDGHDWKLMDPTFASSGKQSREIMQYIGNGGNYKAKYSY